MLFMRDFAMHILMDNNVCGHGQEHVLPTSLSRRHLAFRMYIIIQCHILATRGGRPHFFAIFAAQWAKKREAEEKRSREQAKAPSANSRFFLPLSQNTGPGSRAETCSAVMSWQSYIWVLSCPDSHILVAYLGTSVLAVLSVLFWMPCPAYPVPAVLPWLFSPSSLSRHSCAGSPVLLALFWLSRSGCPILSVSFWLSCSVLNVLFLLSSPFCTALAVLFYQSCAGSPVLAVVCWQPCLGSPVLGVFFGPSGSACPVLPVLFYLSTSDCPVLSVQFWLSCSACPILSILCLCIVHV